MSEIRVKSTGTIKLFESDNTSHVTIASPASLSANRTITIPDADVTLGAGTTINNNADNRVITGSGTANTLNGEANLTFDGTDLDVGASCKISSNGAIANFSNHNGSATETTLATSDGNEKVRCFNDGKVTIETAGTQRMQIDANGTVSIGTADSAADNNAKDLIVGGSSGTHGMTIYSQNNATGRVHFSDGTSGAGQYAGQLKYDHSNNAMTISTSGTERMRIDSGGKLLINTASDLGTSQGVLHVKGKSSANIARFGAGSNGEEVVFVNPSNTQVGSISINSSSTSFNTSSDYRLKENAVAISDGITRLKTLKPYRFNFIADNDADGNPTQTVDGFFAHEVTAVPEAISGEKDAMYPEVLYTADDELPEGKEIGDVKEETKINSQGIDQSKLVPLLVASVQELIAENETLKTRITALENA